jgi:drug/metabolite transporter (DMT)-like permease
VAGGVALVRKKPLLETKNIHVWILVMQSSFGTYLFSIGLKNMELGDANAIYFSQPILVGVAAYLYLKEPFDIKDFFITVIMIIGIVFVVQPHSIANLFNVNSGNISAVHRPCYTRLTSGMPLRHYPVIANQEIIKRGSDKITRKGADGNGPVTNVNNDNNASRPDVAIDRHRKNGRFLKEVHGRNHNNFTLKSATNNVIKRGFDLSTNTTGNLKMASTGEDRINKSVPRVKGGVGGRRSGEECVDLPSSPSPIKAFKMSRELACFLVIISAITSAGTYISNRKCLDVDYTTVMCSISAGTVAVGLSISAVYTTWSFPTDAKTWLYQLAMSLIHFFSRMCVVLALKMENAAVIAIVRVTEIPLSYLLQIIVFGALPNALSWVGSALITVTIFLYGLKKYRSEKEVLITTHDATKTLNDVAVKLVTP